MENTKQLEQELTKVINEAIKLQKELGIKINSYENVEAKSLLERYERYSGIISDTNYILTKIQEQQFYIN